MANNNLLEIPQIELKQLKAVIKDVKINKEAHFAMLSVEITYDGNSWNKAFRLDFNNKILLKDFKNKLFGHIQEDIQRESNLREILDVQGKDIIFEDKK